VENAGEEQKQKPKIETSGSGRQLEKLALRGTAMLFKRIFGKWLKRIPAPVVVNKTARNEKIKLRATFCNNIAAGAAIGGAVVPYVSLVQSETNSLSLRSIFTLSMTGPELQALTAMIVAFAIALILRMFADSILDELQD
jgi:hypothetical protein